MASCKVTLNSDSITASPSTKVKIVNPIRTDKSLISLHDAARFVGKGRAEWVGSEQTEIRMNESHPIYKAALETRIASILQADADQAQTAREASEEDSAVFSQAGLKKMRENEPERFEKYWKGDAGSTLRHSHPLQGRLSASRTIHFPPTK